MSDDDLDGSYYRPLRLLLQRMDDTIGELYAARGEEAVKPRYVGPLIALHRHGPLTVKQLGERVRTTHSAASQTVAAMERAGLVVVATGAGDARTRQVGLTAEAERLVPMLRAEWRATEATVRELDAELPRALLQVVADIEAALERRPFRDRLEAHFAEQLAAVQGAPEQHAAPADTEQPGAPADTEQPAERGGAAGDGPA